MFDDYLNTLRDSTREAYGEDLADFARWFLATNGRPPAPGQVTSIDLREYQGHMVTVRGLKPATVNRRLAAIRSWLRWEVDRGNLAELPRFPRRVAEARAAPKSLDKLSLARFLRAVEREGSARDKALVALMVNAGLRVSEAVRVLAEDVEVSERKGKVVVRSGKGLKRREVPLGPDARVAIRDWLAARPPGSRWLFPGQGEGPLTTRAAQAVISKYAYLSRVDGVTPHVLRHTFATRLLRAGKDIVIVAGLLGHARLDTTAKYTRPAWADLEKAVEDEG
ncbi:tyrosine-type recombinase/integrase [Moorella naiadis]|uniref:tyrosine-type recombinase/integrase n=1 Tax=Moorella naiadis (nom. illeg.) TaxID=3093670 RepID=UPI003D9CBD31